MWIRHGRLISRGAVCALLVAACGLGGCVVKSTSPVVADKEGELDARLIGSWQGQGKESAVVTARGEDYRIILTNDQGVPATFVGRLGRLGAYRVLDLSPADSAITQNDSYSDMLLALHTFLVIDSIGAQLRARGIQPDSLKAYLEREPTAVAHVKVEDGVVLTAPTAELRSFLERFMARPGVLEGASAWTRR